MPARFAIIGHPVTHSLSPILHGAAFRALGIDATYDRLTIRTEDLTVAWEEQLRPHYNGFNVTLPLKSAVIPLLDSVEELAAAVGAV
ncbi:MAG: shikimate dehydrogenase, partial [Bacteroidota bacterium]